MGIVCPDLVPIVVYDLVPLFIILSGYLLNYRNINIKHFLSIRKVLFQYFLCTILLFLFDVMKGWRVASFRSFVDNLVSFGQYSWYIKKYVLLFIMIPFINTFFRKVKNKTNLFVGACNDYSDSDYI